MFISKRQFFQRNNKKYDLTVENLSDAPLDIGGSFVSRYRDKDSLMRDIHSLHPIASEMETTIITAKMDSLDMDMMKQFFHRFWYTRNNADPEGAWIAYKEEVRKADDLFGYGRRPGYDTDRGFTYLKYGAPNSISDRPNEVNSYPYQIWHYYKAGQYSNKRFVFIDRELTNSNYTLLHSDVPGERWNPRWQIMLEQRNNPTNNPDTETAPDSYGSRSKEFYQNPY